MKITKIKYFLINCLLILNFIPDVSAKDIETGESLFLQNCNVCHIGGNNIIIPEKNLRKETLKANGMDQLEAIVYQITNGKNGMPAFGGRLHEIQIEKIGNYVLSNSWELEKKFLEK
jgi:cytochrome c6